MNIEMNTLIENIKEDYLNWTTRCGGRELSDINKTMIAEFNDGLTINGGIFKQWNSSFSMGLEIKNIEILPMKWTTGYQESWSPEIFLGGSITPVMQNMWCKITCTLSRFRRENY